MLKWNIESEYDRIAYTEIRSTRVHAKTALFFGFSIVNAVPIAMVVMMVARADVNASFFTSHW